MKGKGDENILGTFHVELGLSRGLGAVESDELDSH